MINNITEQKMKKNEQYSEVFNEISSGKSLLQLYLEVKEERDQAVAKLAANRILDTK